MTEYEINFIVVILVYNLWQSLKLILYIDYHD